MIKGMAKRARITQRNLSRDEAILISDAIKLTPNITGYRPSELTKLTSVLIAENDRDFIGVLAYVEGESYIDLKLFIILEKFRDKGYGAQLFNSFMDSFKPSGKPIYSVTKNPAVIHLLKESGFVKTSFIRLPLASKLHQAGMVFSFYRIKESVRKFFKFRHGGKFSYWIKR
jgi:hypothetical protein